MLNFVSSFALYAMLSVIVINSAFLSLLSHLKAFSLPLETSPSDVQRNAVTDVRMNILSSVYLRYASRMCFLIYETEECQCSFFFAAVVMSCVMKWECSRRNGVVMSSFFRPLVISVEIGNYFSIFQLIITFLYMRSARVFLGKFKNSWTNT